MERGSLFVLVRDLHLVEGPDMIEKPLIIFRILRQLEGKHFRTPSHDFRAFDGVVIDKDKAVQPQLEFLGERLDVSRFGLPVHS